MRIFLTVCWIWWRRKQRKPPFLPTLTECFVRNCSQQWWMRSWWNLELDYLYDSQCSGCLCNSFNKIFLLVFGRMHIHTLSIHYSMVGFTSFVNDGTFHLLLARFNCIINGLITLVRRNWKKSVVCKGLEARRITDLDLKKSQQLSHIRQQSHSIHKTC
jgi:hypothetical protein